MKPELKMAQMLSSDEAETKLASMSVEKLMSFLKGRKKDAPPLTDDVVGAVEKKANGDMLQYYQDNPEKLKEKQERDAKKEKKAGLEDVGVNDLLQMAHELGIELAHKEKVAISFNKVNEGTKLVGRVSRLVEKHGPAVKEFAGSAARAAGKAVGRAGEAIGNIKSPVARGAATGAAIGGLGGAAQGFIDPKENDYTGERYRVRTALRRGLAGAASGALTGSLLSSMNKSSSVQKLAAAMEKRALGMAGIGSMAKNFVGSMKPIAQKAMAAAPGMAQNAMAKAAPMATKALAGKTMGQAAGMGAAVGAGLGAAKGLVAPGKDAMGQPKSRLGAMARGAVGGAALGAGAGAGAKAALPHLQKAYKSVTPGLHAPARTGANFVAREHTAITPAFKPGITQAIPQRR